MNIKAIGYIGVLLAVLGFIGAEWFFARNYQRNIDLLVRPDTGKVIPLERIIKRLPAETVYVASKPISRLPKPAPIHNTTCDSLRAANDSLMIPREATVVTSHGETIEVTYDPETENFTVIPTPLVIIEPTERLITRNLPELQSPSAHFWAGMDLLWSGTPGVIGHIGYDQVGLSLGNVAEKPCWGVSVHLAL